MTREVHQVFRNVARKVVDHLRDQVHRLPERLTSNREAIEELRITCKCDPGQLEYVLLSDLVMPFVGSDLARRRLTLIRVADPHYARTMSRGTIVHLWTYEYKGTWTPLFLLCEAIPRIIIPLPVLLSEISPIRVPVLEEEGPTLEESIKAVSVDVDAIAEHRVRGDGSMESDNVTELQDSLRSLAKSLLREFKKSMT